jgi:hypothetical protein
LPRNGARLREIARKSRRRRRGKSAAVDLEGLELSLTVLEEKLFAALTRRLRRLCLWA